jgi:hypothetical protein
VMMKRSSHRRQSQRRELKRVWLISVAVKPFGFLLTHPV